MVDPVSGQPASLSALIDKGSFNPTSGKIRNPTTGLEMSVATAERTGLAVVNFPVDSLLPPDQLSAKDLTLDETGDRVFVTPGGQTMSLRDAVSAGIYTAFTIYRVAQKTHTILLSISLLNIDRFS